MIINKGFRSLADIKSEYYVLDTAIYDGDAWELYEHEEYGDERKMIAVNVTKGYYTLTWECLSYTVANLADEYELYSLL